MNKLDLLRRRAALVRKAREAPAKVAESLAARKAAPSPQQVEAPQPIPTPVNGSTVESFLSRKRAINMKLSHPIQYAEIRRIIGMPLVQEMSEAEVERWNQNHVLAQALEDPKYSHKAGDKTLSGFRLWSVQCQAIQSFDEFQGLFAPVGVGWGKTLITQAIANRAYLSGLRRILLLIPSCVLVQLIKTDFPFARTKIPINYPVHILGGKSVEYRKQLVNSGKKGVYIMPYSLLSQSDASANLDAIRPELIIADEADKLANRKAACTKRLFAYIDEYRPLGAVLSGTITSKTIKDYWHLIKWCLGDYCPLPLSASLATEWAAMIDSCSTSTSTSEPIRPLVEWAQEAFPEEGFTEDVTGFRKAYKLRLRSAPGVAATGDQEIGPSLILHNEEVAEAEESPGWDTLTELIDQVTGAWLTPNGDEISLAIHTWKWLYELSAGFYNELTWPAPGAMAERHRITADTAYAFLDEARRYHATLQDYDKELRHWIENSSEKGLDTPMLVGGEMFKHGARRVGLDLYGAWQAWKSAQADLKALAMEERIHDSTPKELDKRIGASFRDSNIVRVCPYKIDQAVNWALSRKGGAILWVYHIGMGTWLMEALQEAGIDALHCPAGNPHNARIIDPANAGRIIVASIRAHGRGKNLWRFGEQLFVQWPRQAKAAEQALGRLHRNGQKRPEVWAYTNNTTQFDTLNFAACLNDSLYIHQTTGSRQKLIYCTYSPKLPKVFPVEVLRERGFQNKALTVEQEASLLEKFSSQAS